MNCAKGAYKTAEDSAEKKGQKKQAKRPPESLDKTVTGQQAGEPNQGVKLKEKCYRLLYPEIYVRGKDHRILQVSILRETALHKEEKEQAEEECLADSPYPDQAPCLHRTTLCCISFCES
jgi:hypothetical protein